MTKIFKCEKSDKNTHFMDNGVAFAKHNNAHEIILVIRSYVKPRVLLLVRVKAWGGRGRLGMDSGECAL